MHHELAMLESAKVELTQATSRIEAFARTVEDVYRRNVLAGEEDAVVELAVRRTLLITLRSTLQACPDSALVAMFNEKRSPAKENNVDAQGRRILGCDSICFGKSWTCCVRESGNIGAKRAGTMAGR